MMRSLSTRESLTSGSSACRARREVLYGSRATFSTSSSNSCGVSMSSAAVSATVIRSASVYWTLAGPVVRILLVRAEMTGRHNSRWFLTSLTSSRAPMLWMVLTFLDSALLVQATSRRWSPSSRMPWQMRSQPPDFLL